MLTASSDNTVMREYAKQIRNLIAEYNLVKINKHPHFKFASDLFKARNVPRQTFYKYYHKLNTTGSFMPCKRGPKNPHRTYSAIENAVLKARESGFSRFEIHMRLKPVLKRLTPSPSTIYNILRRHGVSKLRPTQKRCKRMIIKEHKGDLIHFDCYHLPRGIVKDVNTKLYLIGGIDDASRIAWVEVMEDVTSLSAMFSGMQILRLLEDRYGVIPKVVMTDNGPEFKNVTHPEKHAFERLLKLLHIEHIYTKPYKPQPNGKIERFWRTLYEDILEEAEFNNIEELKDELESYLLYYNEHRPHQALGGKVPAQF